MEEEEDKEIGLLQEEIDSVQNLINEIFEAEKFFDDSKSDRLINDVTETVMEYLFSLQKPYKYMINCLAAQRMGTGFTNNCSAYWDTNIDRVYHFYYPREKNQGGKDKPLIFGLVTIFMISHSKGG